MRSILDSARTSDDPTPRRLPTRTLVMRLPPETLDWMRQQAKTHGCAIADLVRAHIAGQVVSELTALYEQHTISPAEFEATLWSVLGYKPEFSPGEEAHERT